MGMQKYIPTPEEIASLVKAREAGASVKTIREAMELKNTNASLIEANQELARMAASRGTMGTQERRNIFDALLRKHGLEPAEELILMLKDESHPFYIKDTGMRVQMLEELMQYRMPKLRSVEVTEKHEMEINVTILRIGEDGSLRQEPVSRAPAPVVDVTTFKEEGK